MDVPQNVQIYCGTVKLAITIKHWGPPPPGGTAKLTITIACCPPPPWRHRQTCYLATARCSWRHRQTCYPHGMLPLAAQPSVLSPRHYAPGGTAKHAIPMACCPWRHRQTCYHPGALPQATMPDWYHHRKLPLAALPYLLSGPLAALGGPAIFAITNTSCPWRPCHICYDNHSLPLPYLLSRPLAALGSPAIFAIMTTCCPCHICYHNHSLPLGALPYLLSQPLAAPGGPAIFSITTTCCPWQPCHICYHDHSLPLAALPYLLLTRHAISGGPAKLAIFQRDKLAFANMAGCAWTKASTNFQDKIRRQQTDDYWWHTDTGRSSAPAQNPQKFDAILASHGAFL